VILPLTKIEFTRSKLKGPLHQGGSRILGNFGIILAGKCVLNFAKLLLWLPKRMIMFPGRRIRAAFLLLGAVVFLMTVALAVAHAVLLESSPAPKSSVNGPDVPLRLRFNVRIDAARSRLTLVDPDGSSQTLEISKEDPPNTISAEAKGLHPGAYRLRWQVLASDGHITRGEIPFTVVEP